MFLSSFGVSLCLARGCRPGWLCPVHRLRRQRNQQRRSRRSVSEPKSTTAAPEPHARPTARASRPRARPLPRPRAAPEPRPLPAETSARRSRARARSPRPRARPRVHRARAAPDVRWGGRRSSALACSMTGGRASTDTTRQGAAAQRCAADGCRESCAAAWRTARSSSRCVRCAERSCARAIHGLCGRPCSALQQERSLCADPRELTRALDTRPPPHPTPTHTRKLPPSSLSCRVARSSRTGRWSSRRFACGRRRQRLRAPARSRGRSTSTRSGRPSMSPRAAHG